MPRIHGGSKADMKMFDEAYVEHNRGVKNEHGEFDAANDELCRIVHAVLKANFPGHPWAVEAACENGIVKICLQGFMQWQHVIHITSMKGDPKLRPVVKAGGELLERLNMPRTGFAVGDWQKALRVHPAHFKRHAAPPTG